MAVCASQLQWLLVQSPAFRGRIQMLLSTVAAAVLVETGVGGTHAARAVYAKNVLLNPANVLNPAVIFITQSTNVSGTITMEDEGPRTSVTDSALLSQITASWNQLAGLDTGS